jgi:RNA methyltransferase, TrmH family
LLGGPGKRLSAAAYRTAEGAAEFVDVYFSAELQELLAPCKQAGFAICATSSHKGRSLYQGDLPERAVLLLGAERDGLHESLMRSADHLLCIPGSSKVESLNVASSAAVLMAEHWRQHRSRRH